MLMCAMRSTYKHVEQINALRKNVWGGGGVSEGAFSHISSFVTLTE